MKEPDSYDSRISLRKLEVFCLVVDLGGVGKAAEHLYVAQPVVSAHVRSLQDRIGTQLMYRDGNAMHLTEDGRLVYAWATETLARTRELTRELGILRAGGGGSVTISASMTVGSYVLPPLLVQFRRERPQAEISLTVSDSDAAITAVGNGVSDLAVVVSDHPPGDRQLVAERLGSEVVTLVTAVNGEPSESSVLVHSLETLPLVSGLRGHARRTLIDGQLDRAGVKPRNITIELGHAEAIKCAVREGLGAALLFHSSVEDELKAGSLRSVEIRDLDLSVPVFAVRRAHQHSTPIQDQFQQFLHDRMRHLLRQGGETTPAGTVRGATSYLSAGGSTH